MKFTTNRVQVNGQWCDIELWDRPPFDIVFRYPCGDRELKLNLNYEGAFELAQALVDVGYESKEKQLLRRNLE